MSQDLKIALLVSLPEVYFDCLRKMAAKHNYENPREQTSAATIARGIICRYLDGLDEEQTMVSSDDPTMSITKIERR